MRRLLPLAGIACLVLLPFGGLPDYFLHLVILVLLWGFLGTSWALMGRFGLVSLGHGGFMGIGAYSMALLWNRYGLAPWLGLVIGIGAALLLAFLIGYPSFHLRVVGHYFALVTLALGEVVRLSIIAGREVTGGSLGLTPERVRPPSEVSWYALQFADKRYYYFIVLGVWLAALVIWRRVEGSMARRALEAVSEDEVAAASMGVHVTTHKLRITLLSAGLTALGGILLGLYNQYLDPETLSGIGISLEVVFTSIVGGMFSLLGPTLGAVLTILLREGLRSTFGAHLAGMAETLYGLLLIAAIIFMPRGLLGFVEAQTRKRQKPPAVDVVE